MPIPVAKADIIKKEMKNWPLEVRINLNASEEKKDLTQEVQENNVSQNNDIEIQIPKYGPQEKDVVEQMDEKIKIDMLKEVPKENYFYLVNGTALKSLNELKAALVDMDNETFRHHVNEERNDFSNWVKYSFYAPEFAEEMLTIVTKEQLLEKFQKNEK